MTLTCVWTILCICEGLVSTIAGTAGSAGFVDGAGSVAKFHWPIGVSSLFNGDLMVSDNTNHVIRKITSLGTN